MRGFAVKFYTDEGNFDLVGNNMPVFFIQDAIKFPDLIHAVKPEPHNEIPQAASAHDTFWDFISLMPESMHMIMWVMSDRAIPRSFRMMEGFGVHTFRFVNAKGKSRFVKFHWKPLLGVHSVVWDEAQKISGKDPDFHRRDLWEAIESGNFPEWEFGVQIVEEKDEHKFDFDLLDPTKIIPEELVPVQRDRQADAQPQPRQLLRRDRAGRVPHRARRARASTSPTIRCCRAGCSPTPTRSSSASAGRTSTRSRSTGRSRPVHNNQRDGFMRQTINAGRVSYEPNSLGGNVPGPGRRGRRRLRHAIPEPIEGAKVRARGESFFDHFSQAPMFFHSQSEPEQQHIIKALRFELGKVETLAVRERMVAAPRPGRRDAGGACRQGAR